jgi:hypothetical protein
LLPPVISHAEPGIPRATNLASSPIFDLGRREY